VDGWREGHGHVVELATFADLAPIADTLVTLLRDGNSVRLVPLGERNETRRIVDFVAGLVFGLGGSLEKAGSSEYLIHGPADRGHRSCGL
jgi:FtsZ-interacting cell division protein YlmF